MPTIGSFTIGTGGDYPNWRTAFADLAPLTGPLTYTQITPTFENLSIVMPGGFSFNNHLFTVEAQINAHQGNQENRALVIATDLSGRVFDFSGAVDDPKIIIQNLHIEKRIGTDVVGIYFNTNTTPFLTNLKIIRYIFISGKNFGDHKHGIHFDDEGFVKPATSVLMHHVMVHNGFRSGIKMGVGIGSVIENVVARGWDLGGFDLERSGPFPYGTVQNCFSFFNQLEDFKNVGSVIGYNNASEDVSAANVFWTSGSGNLFNRIVADEIYTDSPKFYRGYPKFTGALIGAGKPPIIGITKDMAGQQFPRTRVTPIGPDDTVYTIGSHQWSVLETDTLETEDDMVAASKSNVSGEDSFIISDQADVVQGLASDGSDVLEISEEANVVATHIVSGSDVLELLDAGIEALEFECIPEDIELRRRTNFWHPLDTLEDILTLPQPIIDDQYSLHTQVRTRHAKGGDLRFFKKNEVVHTLLMNFRFERPTRDLALQFFEISSSKLIKLYDWEGRWWQGVIINTPITFTAQGKSGTTEAFSMSIEFEGIRINN